MILLLTLTLLAPVAQAQQCVCVAPSGGGLMNIRECASTSCAILGSEPPGSCYDYLGPAESNPSWHEIQYGAQVGYASGDLMSGPQTCATGGSDCYNQLCGSNPSNVFRTCDAYGCGNYGASRGSRDHTGVDVRCSAGSAVYAPISGTLGYAYPYGDGTCCDNGFVIDGTGAWAGHRTMVFYCEPNSALIGSSVSQGQQVATHIGLSCGNCYETTMTDHSHIQNDLNGQRIDPSSWLTC